MSIPRAAFRNDAALGVFAPGMARGDESGASNRAQQRFGMGSALFNDGVVCVAPVSWTLPGLGALMTVERAETRFCWEPEPGTPQPQIPATTTSLQEYSPSGQDCACPSHGKSLAPGFRRFFKQLYQAPDVLLF